MNLPPEIADRLDTACPPRLRAIYRAELSGEVSSWDAEHDRWEAMRADLACYRPRHPPAEPGQAGSAEDRERWRAACRAVDRHNIERLRSLHRAAAYYHAWHEGDRLDRATAQDRWAEWHGRIAEFYGARGLDLVRRREELHRDGLCRGAPCGPCEVAHLRRESERPRAPVTVMGAA